MHRFAVTAIATLLLTGAPARADLLINVSKAQQRLSVTVNGHESYRWPISTGRGRYATPAGTWRPTRLEKNWYSRKYDMAPMPYSVFFHRGYAVHGTTELSALGRPASHGCVRLDPANASILFNLVKRYGSRNTKVVVLNGALPSAPPAPRNDPVAKLADAGDDAAEAPKLVSAQPAAKPKPAKVAHNENLSAKALTAPPEAVPAVKQAMRSRTTVSLQRSASVGDEARVLREREAWLRAIDRQYGVTR